VQADIEATLVGTIPSHGPEFGGEVTLVTTITVDTLVERVP